MKKRLIATLASLAIVSQVMLVPVITSTENYVVIDTYNIASDAGS